MKLNLIPESTVKIAESINQEMRDFIDDVYKKEPTTKASYSDIQAIFVCTKLAQMQEQITELKENKGHCSCGPLR